LSGTNLEELDLFDWEGRGAVTVVFDVRVDGRGCRYPSGYSLWTGDGREGDVVAHRVVVVDKERRNWPIGLFEKEVRNPIRSPTPL
jgi:hypothetical protein